MQDTCVQLRTGDGSTCEGQDLSNFLSNYYATNGKLLAEGIPNTPLGTNEDCFPEIRTTFKFRFVPLTVIEKYINKIDITKSSGIPGTWGGYSPFVGRYQLRNYSPHLLAMDSSWISNIQIHSPLF